MKYRSRIHPDDLKGLSCLYCVMCDIISYELSAPQKYSSTHFSAVRAGQRPGRCVRRWNLISHYTQHKRNIKTIFCPGWAGLGWAGLGWPDWVRTLKWGLCLNDSVPWLRNVSLSHGTTSWYYHPMLMKSYIINSNKSVRISVSTNGPDSTLFQSTIWR